MKRFKAGKIISDTDLRMKNIFFFFIHFIEDKNLFPYFCGNFA